MNIVPSWNGKSSSSHVSNFLRNAISSLLVRAIVMQSCCRSIIISRPSSLDRASLWKDGSDRNIFDVGILKRNVTWEFVSQLSWKSFWHKTSVRVYYAVNKTCPLNNTNSLLNSTISSRQLMWHHCDVQMFIQFVTWECGRGSTAENCDLWLTILMSIFSLSLWNMQKSVRGNSPRREKPRANQLYRSFMPFFTWKNTVFSGQSTIHVSFTFSIGSRVTWCIWFGETSLSESGEKEEKFIIL